MNTAVSSWCEDGVPASVCLSAVVFSEIAGLICLSLLLVMTAPSHRCTPFTLHGSAASSFSLCLSFSLPRSLSTLSLVFR